MIDFRGTFHDFSNFSSHPVTIYGWKFPNGEAAFHAQKYTDAEYWAKLQDASPSQAKRLGRTVPLDAREWDRDRVGAMKLVVAAKTLQNDLVRTLLLDTHDEWLVETNTWHDNFWGDCECGRPACHNVGGVNMLGKIWMQQREYWQMT